MTHRRVGAAGLLAALVLAACVDDADDPEPEDPIAVEASDTDLDGGGDVDGGPDDVDEILAELAEGGFCDPADVDELGLVTAMHFVVRGQIQPPCHVDGGEDPRLLDAWGALTMITPSALVDDISLLAAFEPCSDCDTLAFVTTLDEQASFFLMAVDVVSGTDDPDELLLTMQHELSHVFTQEPGVQLEVGDDDGACPTYHNGTGCFTAGSYMASWIAEFWPSDLLDELPDDGAPFDDDTAAERCELDPTFTGSYAATHPEEDFAETFSAYVFDIDVPASLDAKLDFFDRYPEFVEIREAAASQGLNALPNTFEGCG